MILPVTRPKNIPLFGLADVLTPTDTSKKGISMVFTSLTLRITVGTNRRISIKEDIEKPETQDITAEPTLKSISFKNLIENTYSIYNFFNTQLVFQMIDC